MNFNPAFLPFVKVSTRKLEDGCLSFHPLLADAIQKRLVLADFTLLVNNMLQFIPNSLGTKFNAIA